MVSSNNKSVVTGIVNRVTSNEEGHYQRGGINQEGKPEVRILE